MYDLSHSIYYTVGCQIHFSLCLVKHVCVKLIINCVAHIVPVRQILPCVKNAEYGFNGIWSPYSCLPSLVLLCGGIPPKKAKEELKHICGVPPSDAR